jgi:hypothetical protein
VITCDAYDVDVEVDQGVPADAFAALLSWFHGRLTAGSDGAPAPVLAPRAIEQTVRGSMLLRSRQRVTLLARRVEADFVVPGWRVEPLRWPTEASAVLPVRGPAEACVEVRFTLGARGKRSTVGVEFRSPDRADGTTAVIEALVEILRERPALPGSPEHREAIRA